VRGARLETGVRQPGAIHLYETSGYQRIERYGRYANDPLSLCFEKSLEAKTISSKCCDSDAAVEEEEP
jgi:hypothetical protein